MQHTAYKTVLAVQNAKIETGIKTAMLLIDITGI